MKRVLLCSRPSKTQSNIGNENFAEMPEEAKVLVNLYRNCFCKDVDYDLMITVLMDIHKSGSKGNQIYVSCFKKHN